MDEKSSEKVHILKDGTSLLLDGVCTPNLFHTVQVVSSILLCNYCLCVHQSKPTLWYLSACDSCVEHDLHYMYVHWEQSQALLPILSSNQVSLCCFAGVTRSHCNLPRKKRRLCFRQLKKIEPRKVYVLGPNDVLQSNLCAITSRTY